MVLVSVRTGSLRISASITVFVYGLLEFVIVNLVAVLALNLLAISLHHLIDSQALWLDSLVSCLDSLEHHALWHLFHLTLHHHDVIVGSGNHQLEVSLLALLESRVDHHLAVHTSYAHLAHRTLERNIGASQSCTRSQTSDGLWHVNAISRVHGYIYKSVCVIIRWE